ncbi:hypothetical protein N0V93_003607 [Gnomoniopsis smithogilvyi]|uniref:Homeobox domain-containing protein n=1 Tax=Gnomoniopsis smithogilvyi TaxID=1191159 RepID=A0A9W9CYS9_9PEZI|nr:hypothetical protein N0V93_003607 [Gnomoniopsis smithogilvyi]
MAQGQQHSPATLMMLQSQGLSYYPAPVKMFSPTMQQSPNAQFYHASLASSKRFSEEEKQKLEKVFTDETQKPSTSRKRQLAEELGCPVPKVNNWFQNRRAREKQMHRVQAYEASQAADRAASENDRDGALEDDEDAAGSEVESMHSPHQAFHTSSNPNSETDASSPGQDDATPESSNGRDNDSVTDSPVVSPAEVLEKTVGYHDAQQQLESGHPHSPHSRFSELNVSLNNNTFDNHQGVLSASPEAFDHSHGEPSFHTLQDQFDYSSIGDLSGLGVFTSATKHSEYFPTAASYMTQRTPTITTSIAEHDDEMETHHTGPHDDTSASYTSLSPDMIPRPSPDLDQTDLTRNQDSSQTSIASRRKIRPPQRLNQTALRDFHNGPKTGIEDTKRTEMFRTMRRAASANGPLSGKIFKSAPPLSPRSPRTFGPGFLEQLTRHSLLSASTGPFTDTSNVSSAGPAFEQRYLSAGHSGIQHRSSMENFGDKALLSPNATEYNQEAALNRAHNLTLLHFQDTKFTHDTGCGNASPDEALTTPSLSQFGSELEFSSSLSAPRYVESEPTTPSYVPVTMPASSGAPSHGFSTLKIEAPQQPHVFPWSRSPDHFSMWNGASLGQFGESQSQTFQFQPNVTPMNFQSPTGT